ncbi:MAG: YceI family protein [Xanthomonadales bacterium]|nr:YceI family protein [Xanthomonadales bacterium]MBK7144904.1 YceI family protein [Xanthomonadales bacterium]MCC6563213.1 YceI family protein [Xanthomonadales bacterium]
MRAVCVAGLLLLLTAARGLAGDAVDYRIEPAQSTIRFELYALGWWPVRGSAVAQGSVVVRDELADIDASVSLQSLTMARAGYREWALSPEFFAATEHPQLEFHTHAIPLRRLREGGVIEGELRVRGRARAARFQLAASDCAASAAPCRVRADGQLSRRAFGMRSRRFTLGDRIRIELDLQLVPVP